MSDMSGEFMENCGFEGKMLCEVVRQCAPCDSRDTTTSEQLAEIEGQPEPVQVREGRWRTRHGAVKNIRPCEPLKGAYYVWPWTDGVMTFQDNGRHQGSKESPNDLVEYLGPIEPDKTQELPDKTQELETKTQELPEYTPPEGWRVVAVGEVLREGDMWVNHEGEWPTKRVGETVNDERYIRRIEPQAEPKAEPVQVREGRWRTRHGWVRNVTPTPEGDGREQRFPWWDAQYRQTWTADGRYHFGGASALDLIEYIGPIEQQPQPVPEPDAATIEELRSEVSYVQRLLGESRQRVTHLEELVTSLRNINEAQEKAFDAAGQDNTALRNQLAAVKAELASVAADRQQLRVELDAAQQVPADSPELRQLWANLAEVAHDRDTYKHAHELLVQDIDATHQRTKAETVETIAEWLEPIRLADSAYLANATMQHLPSIMRHLTGLDSHAID